MVGNEGVAFGEVVEDARAGLPDEAVDPCVLHVHEADGVEVATENVGLQSTGSVVTTVDAEVLKSQVPDPERPARCGCGGPGGFSLSVDCFFAFPRKNRYQVWAGTCPEFQVK